MKIIKKMLLMLVLSVCFFNIIPQNISRAKTLNEIVDGFEADVEPAIENTSEVKNVVKNVLNFLQIVSGLVAVVIIAMTGFDYIIGTPKVQEDAKNRMFPILMGIVIIFGAVTITKFFVSAGGG